MKSIKRILVVSGIVAAIGMTSVTAFAASYKTPAEAVAALTGKTTEAVISQRAETGKTYGTIANQAGKLEEFKQKLLEIKEDILAKRVADGNMTQEQADAAMKAFEENQADCDGAGTGACGLGSGAGCGLGLGNGGAGNGTGRGANGGRGLGNGLRDGSCLAS